MNMIFNDSGLLQLFGTELELLDLSLTLRNQSESSCCSGFEYKGITGCTLEIIKVGSGENNN